MIILSFFYKDWHYRHQKRSERRLAWSWIYLQKHSRDSDTSATRCNGGQQRPRTSRLIPLLVLVRMHVFQLGITYGALQMEMRRWLLVQRYWSENQVLRASTTFKKIFQRQRSTWKLEKSSVCEKKQLAYMQSSLHLQRASDWSTLLSERIAFLRGVYVSAPGSLNVTEVQKCH